MAFRKLTQQQVELLSAEERMAYEQAYEEFCERERFVEKLEQLENVKMPEVQMKKRPIRRVSSPVLRTVQMQEFVPDTKGVDLLNVTDTVRRAASSPVSVSPDERFIVKTPAINAASPRRIDVRMAEAYQVGNISEVPIANPSETQFETREFKVDVPAQQVQNEPEIRAITIADYTIENMGDTVIAAASIAPVIVNSKVGENVYQVSGVSPVDTSAPDAPKVMIADYAVSSIPNTSIDTSAVEPALMSAQAVNEKQPYEVRVNPVPDIAGPVTQEVKMDHYAVEGIPGTLASMASADTAVFAVASQMTKEYKVDVFAPVAVDTPVVQTVDIAPLQDVKVGDVTLAAPVEIHPVMQNFAVQGCEAVVTNAPEVQYSTIAPVSIDPITVSVPEPGNIPVSGAINHYEVNVRTPEAISAPNVQIADAVPVKTVVPEMKIPDITADALSHLPKMDGEAVKAAVSVPEVKIPEFRMPGEFHWEAKPESEKTSAVPMEFAVPEVVTFTAPEFHVARAAVTEIASPSIDSDAEMKAILAAIR